MIIKLFTSTCLLFLFISCNNHKTTNKNTITTDGNQQSPVNCYQYISSNDTSTLKTIHAGEAITGTLVYNLYQKDKNQGTIQGSMKGDLLIADYTFMSEGITSVRQVVFKKEGASFFEGYGKIETKSDRIVFKNTDSLTFNNAVKLVEVDCQQ
jgi:hypothetical protein